MTDESIYEGAPFPHCDELVLHAPGECVHCDHYPELQAVRSNNAIPFSGEGGSPDERGRSREVIDRWGGNRPVKPESQEKFEIQVGDYLPPMGFSPRVLLSGHVETDPLDAESQLEIAKKLGDLLRKIYSGEIQITEYDLCSMIPGTLEISWVPGSK